MIQMQTRPLTDSRGDSFLVRNGFTLIVGAFVILMSFFYGLTRGLQHRPAFAAPDLLTSTRTASELGLQRIELPSGVIPMPLGSDMEVNGLPAEMLSFVTDRSPQRLTEEQMDRWKERGFEVAGKSTVRRGVAFALDRSTGDRYSFSAWSVPGPMQQLASRGLPVQGLMSVVDRADRGDRVQSVPEVPVLPGGKGGAVMSSVDNGYRSYSAAYTNPGTIAENLEFYRSELGVAGWREQFADLHDAEPLRTHRNGSAVFHRGGEEVVLLLSPAAENESGGERTVVAVTRAARVDGFAQRASRQ